MTETKLSKPKKRKQLTVRAPQDLTSSTSLAESLRALIHGLFDTQKPYHPSQQEIADYYLTPREREIAYLAALGFSIQEIADALGLNFQTARQHLRNVLNKMELNDPRELREFFTRDRDVE